MSKIVLITGSEGFVGGHLWKEMEENGYVVFGTSLKESENKNPHVFTCDITLPEKIAELIEDLRPDFIIHLAGFVKPKESISNPDLVFKINVGGTKNIFEAVRSIPKYHPKIIIIGSSEEFGVTTPGVVVTEDTPLSPTNPYGVSKMEAWKLAQEYISKYGLDIVSAISFNHTGPGQALGFIAPDVASQIVEIEKGLKEPHLITGHISHKRNISDVRDVARAYRLLLELGKTGERYIVCADKSIPLSYTVSTLINHALVKINHEVDHEKGRPSDIADISASHAKITGETGWKPEIPIEKTLKDLLDWYRSRNS